LTSLVTDASWLGAPVSFQRDYILRAIEAFARAVAAIVALRKDGQTEPARQEIDRTARGLIGADLSLIDAVGLDAVAAQVDGQENLARLATLLGERAEVERACGDLAAAARWAARAATLQARAVGA
jgi:hypothetical protein